MSTSINLLSAGPSPKVSSFALPSTADLIAWATYMKTVAVGVDIAAAPGQPNNPYTALGALKSLTDTMLLLLQAREREEERNLLLLDRLRFEEQQDAGHAILMETDEEYAEVEGDLP